MTWTYSSASLGLSRNKVRLMIGDVDTTRQQLDDAEIDFVLTTETSPTLAAAVCAEMLSARYTFQTDTTNGALSVAASKRASAYQKLADRLRRGGAGDIPGDPQAIMATMYVGGQSRTAVAALGQNSDNIAPNFSLGMDDFSHGWGGASTTY